MLRFFVAHKVSECTWSKHIGMYSYAHEYIYVYIDLTQVDIRVTLNTRHAHLLPEVQDSRLAVRSLEAD